MYPGVHARNTPDKIAVVLADSDRSLTYRELDDRSAALARVLHDAGLRPGDVVALLTDNRVEAFEVFWAALRSGLYITAVNSHLTAGEVAYIVEDSGAKALVVSATHGCRPVGPARLRRRGSRLRVVRGCDRERRTTTRRGTVRRDHALLVGHHRISQGDPAAVARPPRGRTG